MVDIEVVKEKILRGDSLKAIALDLHVSLGTLINCMRKDNLKANDFRKEKVLELVTQGKTLREISQIVNLTEGSTWNLLHRNGISALRLDRACGCGTRIRPSLNRDLCGRCWHAKNRKSNPAI
jgi:DNA-binding CsgD family transcriptional regulator